MTSDAAKATARAAIERTFDPERFIKLERVFEKGVFGSNEVFTEAGAPFAGRIGVVSLQERLGVSGEERSELSWLICAEGVEIEDGDHVKDALRGRLYKVIGDYAVDPGAITKRFMVVDVGAVPTEEVEDDD